VGDRAARACRGHRRVPRRSGTGHDRLAEKHAAYTRRGTDGVAQVDTTGLIAAAFTHRDSRAGDPDLHTHVAVSNKVCTPDGRWLSLDGRALYRNKVTASEHYNTRVEALLIERVRVRFAERGDAGEGRRDVREIVGLPPELLRAWSSRRADIETELAALARRFQEEHGHLPTTIERTELAQQATLSTRDPKHEPRSEAEQRHAWRAEAAEVLGGADRVEALVRRITDHTSTAATVGDVERLAEIVIATVQASRATWQQHHVRAEAERALSPGQPPSSSCPVGAPVRDNLRRIYESGPGFRGLYACPRGDLNPHAR